MAAKEVIEKLDLKPHPEGGYYRETYRSNEFIPQDALPARYGGDRTFGTAIYFLLESSDQSMLHRLKTDEIWHYYSGSPLNIKYYLDEHNAVEFTLGNDFTAGHIPQIVIPKIYWMVAKPIEPDSYTLVGCTTAPGFEFEDFEMKI